MEVAPHAMLYVVEIISVYFFPYGNTTYFPYLCHQNSVGLQFALIYTNNPTSKCDRV